MAIWIIFLCLNYSLRHDLRLSEEHDYAEIIGKYILPGTSDLTFRYSFSDSRLRNLTLIVNISLAQYTEHDSLTGPRLNPVPLPLVPPLGQHGPRLPRPALAPHAVKGEQLAKVLEEDDAGGGGGPGVGVCPA